MTRQELAGLLGYGTISQVSMALSRAKAVMPSLEKKQNLGPDVIADLSLDEVMCVVGFLDPPLNEIQMELVREGYVSHEKAYIRKKSPYIKGTEEFLARYAVPEYRKQIRCCAACAYCCGRSIAGGSPRLFPYCRFYGRFISRMSIEKYGKKARPNIFTDGCPTFARADSPVIFYR